jgi:hypothetical protein
MKGPAQAGPFFFEIVSEIVQVQAESKGLALVE